MYTLLDDIILYLKFAGFGCMLITLTYEHKNFLVSSACKNVEI